MSMVLCVCKACAKLMLKGTMSVDMLQIYKL